MGVIEILTFLAFGLAVLCFLAWRHGCRNYIPPENLAKQVETRGCGGYKLKYLPYTEAIKDAFLELQNRIVKSGAFR